MTAVLLDANVVIALTVADHEHHARSSSWVSSVDRLALCPIVEGALVRFVLGLGQSRSTAKALLEALHANPRCEFWADSISSTEPSAPRRTTPGRNRR